MKFIEDGSGQYQKDSQAAPAEHPTRDGRKRSPPREKSKHTEKTVDGEVSGLADHEVQGPELLIRDRAPQEIENLPENAACVLRRKDVGRERRDNAKPEQGRQPCLRTAPQ